MQNMTLVPAGRRLAGNIVRVSLLAAILAALGCGGGGGTTNAPQNPPVNPPVTPPVSPPVEPPQVPVEERLQQMLQEQGVSSPELPPEQHPQQVALGRLLFFDGVLSSRRDISCAGCHHPAFNMIDNVALSVGTGGSGLGPERELGIGQAHVARNSIDLINKGLPGWGTMLWDARIETAHDGRLLTPVGDALPQGLSGPLAAQALFAMADTREMFTPLGNNPPQTQEQIWKRLTDQILFFTGYRTLFQAAYPGTPLNQMNITHVANALAAYQTAQFTSLNTPFDRYLRGETDALTDKQKEGAVLFYGKAQCASCHAGPLLSDQKFHNLMVPELGPGRLETPGQDRGRGSVTGRASDRFKFRTPPLRNVALTAPYMHNGAIGTLEAAVRHHLDPLTGFRNLDTSHLPPTLKSTVRNDDALLALLQQTLADALRNPPQLTEEEISALVAFLDEALSDPTLDEILTDIIPAASDLPSQSMPPYY